MLLFRPIFKLVFPQTLEESTVWEENATLWANESSHHAFHVKEDKNSTRGSKRFKILADFTRFTFLHSQLSVPNDVKAVSCTVSN